MVPSSEDRRSCVEVFAGIEVGSRLADNHTFGCPVFALQNKLQGGKRIPKWSPQARLGVNLDPSQNHAQNVNLVLNISTGLVCQQFHVRFDNFFKTVKHSSRDVSINSSWQQLSGLIRPGSNISIDIVDQAPEVVPSISPDEESSSYDKNFPAHDKNFPVHKKNFFAQDQNFLSRDGNKESHDPASPEHGEQKKLPRRSQRRRLQVD